MAESKAPQPREVVIDPPGVGAFLEVPDRAKGLVIFAHGSGSSRFSPRHAYVAKELNRAGFATLLADLLTHGEEEDRRNVFDIELLSKRLLRVAQWASEYPKTRDLPVGLFGASTGAAAALVAAADPHLNPACVVSRGGRPDLAGEYLAEVRAPVLLLVGSLDGPVIDLNRMAFDRLSDATLIIVPGAGHLFEEPGAMDEVVTQAIDFFGQKFAGPSERENHRGVPRPNLR
ncbi:alpha/beta hydrolase [Caulobacter sp. 17J65-9]|uniref:dienelactone hydrolase family protein n=1 Tax=Caulobacter sp. 17J65-9 TaxID=2709382 RepID=UPI0013CD9C7B|nr:alpha/beta hydrolase [Caulobacter sp. 17J65-9]NEX93758.1 alpha/beta hydrolase [Caulobacter sp. 17J65-9]